MIVPYTAQPFGAWPRPLLDVQIGEAGFSVKALVDSGATNTLFDACLAEEVGVLLDDSNIRVLHVGGGEVQARFTTVSLFAAGHRWEAEVGFCASWTAGWGLLGQESFFRFFTITFRGADLEFELEPREA